MVIVPNPTPKRKRPQVQCKFQITQHSRDGQLMISIMEYLGCGNLTVSRNAIDLRVTKLNDLTDKILPFFERFPLQGFKYSDYLIFVELVKLMKEKAHLTDEGLVKIIELKARFDR